MFFCYDPTINNARLLRLYGFCIPNNPNDIVDIYAPLNPAMPLYQPKVLFFIILTLLLLLLLFLFVFVC